MKTVIIADIHGRNIWKDILRKEEDWDRIIFLGDYVDTHDDITGLEQLNNLREIIKFKLASDKEVVLLIGNHDHHYWPGVGYTGTSGYQPGMAVSFEYEYATYKDLFQMVYMDENNIIYSHAGITETWLNDVGIGNIDNNLMVNEINELFKHKPHKFNFYPNDSSNTGDNIHQSPIWVRPKSLYRDGVFPLQVVGHTQVNKIDHSPKSERRGFYLTDALGTTKEYLVIIDGKIIINRCNG